MKNNKKDQFFAVRIVNMVIGAAILLLVLLSVTMDLGNDIYYVLIFALASIETFLAATVSFAEKKRARANVYAITGAIFLIMAVVTGLQFYGIL